MLDFAGNERSVLKNYLKKFLPSYEIIQKSRWLRPFKTWLHHPNLWHLHRRSVAGGVAVGLFTGLIPGPLQMVGAALLAVLFRVNLPLALFTTLYSNPLTIAPLYLLAYELGALVTGQHNHLSLAHFATPQLSWSSWASTMLDWIASFGKPLAVGLPLLAITLSIVGYFSVRLLWYVMVAWEWRRRAARRRL